MKNKEQDLPNYEGRRAERTRELDTMVLFITIKPSFASYKKRSYEMCNTVYEELMRAHELLQLDASYELDSKHVTHLHAVVTNKTGMINITNIVNFKKGMYFDVRILKTYQDLDVVINYINKDMKSSEVRKQIESQYSFI